MIPSDGVWTLVVVKVEVDGWDVAWSWTPEDLVWQFQKLERFLQLAVVWFSRKEQIQLSDSSRWLLSGGSGSSWSDAENAVREPLRLWAAWGLRQTVWAWSGQPSRSEGLGGQPEPQEPSRTVEAPVGAGGNPTAASAGTGAAAGGESTALWFYRQRVKIITKLRKDRESQVWIVKVTVWFPDVIREQISWE